MNEITFVEQNLALIERLAEVSRRKKLLEKQENEVKDELLPLMEKHGVESIDNDLLRITYVGASESTSLDTTKLRNEMPDLYEDIMAKYPKTSKRKAHLRFNVK